VREPGSHSDAAMRISLPSGILISKENATMKNLVLTASVITMVAISGQAFARATGSTTHYWPVAANSSDQQVVHAYNAFDPAMVAQTDESDAHTYHGGPKTND
jgi:hypothetical protein